MRLFRLFSSFFGNLKTSTKHTKLICVRAKVFWLVWTSDSIRYVAEFDPTGVSDQVDQTRSLLEIQLPAKSIVNELLINQTHTPEAADHLSVIDRCV